MVTIKLDVKKLAKNAVISEFMDPKGMFDKNYESIFTIVKTSNTTCNAVFWKKGISPIRTRSEMFLNPVDIYAYNAMTGTLTCVEVNRTWEDIINETPDIEPEIHQIVREYAYA